MTENEIGKLNTHFYDGKLRARYAALVSSVDMELKVDGLKTPEETASEILHMLKSNATDHVADDQSLNLSANDRLRAERMIAKLASEDRGANWDAANEIDARQCLCYVWHRVREYDISGKRLFFEQILDIYNGQCPQGRTTRLLQCVPFSES